MAERRSGVLEYANRQKYGEFYKFYDGSENDRTGNYEYKRKGGRARQRSADDEELTPAERAAILRPPPITRLAADQYADIYGKAYRGALIMPEAKDTTYKGSSFSKVITDQKTGLPVLSKEGKTTPMGQAAKPAASLGGGSNQARPLRSQRSLFGGAVRDLMPSQKRDLNRRRSARKQAEKTKKTLGV